MTPKSSSHLGFSMELARTSPLGIPILTHADDSMMIPSCRHALMVNLSELYLLLINGRVSLDIAGHCQLMQINGEIYLPSSCEAVLLWPISVREVGRVVFVQKDVFSFAAQEADREPWRP